MLLALAIPAQAASVHEWRAAHEQEIVGELMQLLAIPNVASDRPNIERNAQHLLGMLRRRGIEARLLETPGASPAVYGDLPSPGETLEYEIRITHHARHGDRRLFFFEYDCISDGRPRLTVRDGQAGFVRIQQVWGL